LVISYNEKMNLCNFKNCYKDDFNHSRKLKKIFGKFKYKGVDYINQNNANIEFKETFAYKERKLARFAVYLKDYLESEYIVFIWWMDYENDKKEIYLHRTKRILSKYKFANKKKIAQPYLSTIEKHPLGKFDDLHKLKIKLDSLNSKKVCEGQDCLDCPELSTCKLTDIDISKLGLIK